MSRSNSEQFGAVLPSLESQANRLIDLRVHELVGLSVDAVRTAAQQAGAQRTDALLAIHPDAVPASALALLLALGDKQGFVVEDMTDVDQFSPTIDDVPRGPVYLVEGLDRGDSFSNWSPEEALPEITGSQRTPLLLTEGIYWVLQHPAVLDRNHCFMTIGSRLRKPNGSYDSRTPALWISNGTGRDGKERRNAPKVGWCWWRNRHTWLGIASAATRVDGLT
ncbi:MAG: hypothetical protein GX542_04140 [Rhodococcus sp.]|nr:hypothetical protein [Rhodococcus sp. (in: high G+C Gram-positive bacteria)]